MASGVAYAVWSATGSGATTAKAGTTTALTATASITGGPLYPGATADLTVVVTNPNAVPVTVTTIAAGTVAASAGCSTHGVTVTIPATVNLLVPANGSAPRTLTGAVAMSTASSSDCQGATFTVPVTVGGKL
jgi:hypothetical protein